MERRKRGVGPGEVGPLGPPSPYRRGDPGLPAPPAQPRQRVCPACRGTGFSLHPALRGKPCSFCGGDGVVDG